MSYKGTEERRRGSSVACLAGFDPTSAACEFWAASPLPSSAVVGFSRLADDGSAPGLLAPGSAARETGAPAAADDRRLRPPGWDESVGARAAPVAVRVGAERPAPSPVADDLRCVRVLASVVEGLLESIVAAFRAAWVLAATSDARLPFPGRVGARVMGAASPGTGADGRLPLESWVVGRPLLVSGAECRSLLGYWADGLRSGSWAPPVSLRETLGLALGELTPSIL